MVILLVLLTGVESLLVAPEDPPLLLLELSAAAVVAVVLFLRGTGFKFGFTGAVSCASGAAKVRLDHQNCHRAVRGGHMKEIQLSEMIEGHRKEQILCVCVCLSVCPSVRPSVQTAMVRCCTEQCFRLRDNSPKLLYLPQSEPFSPPPHYSQLLGKRLHKPIPSSSLRAASVPSVSREIPTRISGFRRGVNIFALLGCYAACIGSYSLLVSFSRACLPLQDGADRLSRNVGNCQSTLRKIPAERRSDLHCGGSLRSCWEICTHLTEL
jgi:hypothetical protein